MKLYLHIGIEKTGSSHLQSLSLLNRELLKQNNIWYPVDSKDERLLARENISIGNAQDITNALNKGDFITCKARLAHFITEAEDKKCHALYLSNELLLLALAQKMKLVQFISILNELGISNINMLLVLRDPVSQALSLFKHRAKNGNIEAIEEWPKTNYHYGNAILSFLKHSNPENINLSVRKFSTTKGYLETILFKDWLGLKGPLKQPLKRVNPSLSLSELLLLKKIRHNEPHMVNMVYKSLVTIDKKDKFESGLLEEYYTNSLSCAMAQYTQTWMLCNRFLPKNEQLIFSSRQQTSSVKKAKTSNFSEAQLEKIAYIITDSNSFKTKYQIFKQKLKSHVMGFYMTVRPKSN